MGQKTTGAAHAGLYLVNDQQQPVGVTDLADLPHDVVVHHHHATLGLDRLDHDGGGLGADRRLEGRHVANGHVVETIDLGPKPVQDFLVAGGRDGRQCAAMETVIEGDDPVAFRVAIDVMMAPRQLDRAFVRFGPGITKKDRVGKAVGDQAVRQALLSGDVVQVRSMHQGGGLFLDFRHQMGVAMTQAQHRQAGGKIQVFAAFGVVHIGAFTPFKCDINSAVGWHDRCRHGGSLLYDDRGFSAPLGKGGGLSMQWPACQCAIAGFYAALSSESGGTPKCSQRWRPPSMSR